MNRPYDPQREVADLRVVRHQARKRGDEAEVARLTEEINAILERQQATEGPAR